jgi:hypothetical protein
MYDGAGLAKAIATNPDDIEAALLAYETKLLPRSASEAAEADRILDLERVEKINDIFAEGAIFAVPVAEMLM